MDIIQSDEANFIPESLKEGSVVGNFNYWVTKHKSGFNEKYIYHFIYNVHQ